MALIAGLLAALRDSVLTHPTMLEGLIPLFSGVPPICKNRANMRWYSRTDGGNSN